MIALMEEAEEREAVSARGQRAGTFSFLIALPDACLLWSGRRENRVPVLALPLSVCVSFLLWDLIFPFGNWGQVEVRAICQCIGF